MDAAKIIDKKGWYNLSLDYMTLKGLPFIANSMTSPFAVWLLLAYDVNIFMTVLFELTDPSLSIIKSAFSAYVYDGVRTLEEHWNTMINAIQIGTLPDIYDLGEYRSHIEERRS